MTDPCQSPFAFTRQPYQGLQKDLAAHLMSYADNPEASPWERCLAGFLRQLYERSHSQVSIYLYSITLHSFFCGSARGGPAKHPEAYTREDVEDFMYQRITAKRSRGQAPSTSTINHRLMMLSSFYRYAASYVLPGSDGRLQTLLSVPAPTLGLPYGRQPRNYRAFSDVELEKFFAVIPTDTVKGLRDRAIFLMYFWTARRRAEIARLTWGDLVQGVIVDERGQRRECWLYHFTGKGKAGSDDIAELPAPAKIALDAYLSASGRLATMRPEDPLFVVIATNAGLARYWGTRVAGGLGGLSAQESEPAEESEPALQLSELQLSAQSICLAFKKYVRAAGLDAQRLSLHSLRHTAARLRFAAGSDVREIQRLLRHESLATTDLYLRGLMGTSDNGALLLIDRFGYLSKP